MFLKKFFSLYFSASVGGEGGGQCGQLSLPPEMKIFPNDPLTFWMSKAEKNFWQNFPAEIHPSAALVLLFKSLTNFRKFENVTDVFKNVPDVCFLQFYTPKNLIFFILIFILL